MSEKKEAHKALFLDLDSTVRTTNVKGRFYPKHPKEQDIMEGRHEKIWEWKNKGYKVFAVSNQGGIGMGLLTKKECEDCLHDLNTRLDGVFDDMVYAPAHPEKDDPYRKPNPGMIHALKDKHDIHLPTSVMVGDSDTDKMAAERAGVKFIWTKDFFNGTDHK